LLLDDVDLSTLLSLLFKRKGMETFVAANMVGALEIAQKETPGILLVSVQLINENNAAWNVLKALAPPMKVHIIEQSGNENLWREIFEN